jgi:hypothetical protein
MKSLIKKNSLFMALCIATSVQAADCPPSNECTVVPMISIRSQGRDRVHQMVESVGHVHRPNEEQWYSSLSAMLVYEKSFRPNKITECFFGSALGCERGCEDKFIKIQGSSFLGDDRDPKALLADYFYLPTDFESNVSFQPRIRTIMADFDYYCDLSGYYSGLYFRVHGPIVHTRWKMGICENIIATGTFSSPAGYFAPGGLTRNQLLQGFTQYAQGCAPNTVTQTFADLPFGLNLFANPITTVFQPLRWTKIQRESESKTGVAEIRVEIGRRFADTEDHHFGIDLQFAIPTGPRKTSCLLFGPQIGNGHHFELGAGVHGHWNFWKNEDESAVAGFYVDANLTHMFSAHQIRTFDLKNRPLSRYMTAMRFTPAASTEMVNDSLPNYQFAYIFAPAEFAPVANLTTLNVNVSATIQADVVAMLNYTKNNWSFDLGYNFWGRSCEKIDCRTTCCPNLGSLCDPLQKNRWALKGDARVYGFGEGGAQGLSATEHCATIHQGTNRVALDFSATDVNSNVDNPGLTNLLSGGLFQINQSFQPILLDCNDIDIVGTRGISNKVFTHVSHTRDYDTWRLHYGIGASAEFGLTDDCCNDDLNCDDDTACDSCINCAVSQWSVWGKVGIDFN